jgi:hypothetical protein
LCEKENKKTDDVEEGEPWKTAGRGQRMPGFAPGGERREMHSCYYGKINASFVRFVIGGSKAAILPFLVFFFS